MKIKEKISIDEFDGKRFQIRLVEPNLSNQKKAVITHYLHNIDNGVSKHIKKEAEKAIKEYVTFKNEEESLSLVAEDALQQLLFEVNDVPFPTPENYTFKFIDLFAGIGGFRMAMQNLGGKCVFTSEWDKDAQRTYRANFGEVPFGDITKEQTKKFIPDGFDVLGVPLLLRSQGRAFCSNLFVRSSQKGFTLQSLTHKIYLENETLFKSNFRQRTSCRNLQQYPAF